MNKKYASDLSFGKTWEKLAKQWLVSLGYSVDEYVCYDDNGIETYQMYVYLDGKKYNHPDLIVTKKDNLMYIEVKSFGRYYKNSNHPFSMGSRYLSLKKFDFESYLQLSLWKESPTHVIFIVYVNGTQDWYSMDIFDMDKTKIYFEDAYTPKESGEYYFWDVSNMKQINQ